MNTITLKKGKWEAQILPAFAMNVIALSCEGEAVLRSPESIEDLQERPFLYGTPLLFPPDVMYESTFYYEGKSYTIPYREKNGKLFALHGLLYDAPMEIMEQTESFVAGEFACGSDRYPFPFSLRIECNLTDEGMQQKYCIRNTGNTSMPVVLGLHTTFVAHGQFTVSIDKVWRMDAETRMPAELVALSDMQEAFKSGSDPQGTPIHGFFSDSGAHTATIGRYRYQLSENFRQWVVWNMRGDNGFISLEPLSGTANGLNMDGQYIRLEPGEMEVFETRISLK